MFARAVAIVALASAALLGLPGTSEALTHNVAIVDNRFEPQELRIDPGDTVVWTNRGGNTHTVNSDKRLFKSGELQPGDSFRHTFDEEGYYYYHCRFHGGRGRVGQWGIVIVGDLPPPPDEGKKPKHRKPLLIVPDEFPTIQKAVDAAKPGSVVLIKPGKYHESVTVQTPRITIRGVDRFRTVLHGRDRIANGITIDGGSGANGVSVENLTVRNYVSNGVYVSFSRNYRMERIDSIKNRIYGLYAFHAYDGVIRDSFAWGSGDAGIYIGECIGCGADIDNVHAERNHFGYSGTNATGVVIRNSTWVHNGIGIFPNSLPFEQYEPNRGTLIYNNVIRANNYDRVPAAGFTEIFGGPLGTGIWLFGVENNVVLDNVIRNHDRYGVVITVGMDAQSVPLNNRIRRNRVSGSDIYELAWDGAGANNCFSNNKIKGATGPPEAQTLYACDARPFVGIPWAPVIADVVPSIALGPQTRDQDDDVPEPNRPECQRGAPGCHRH